MDGLVWFGFFSVAVLFVSAFAGFMGHYPTHLQRMLHKIQNEKHAQRNTFVRILYINVLGCDKDNEKDGCSYILFRLIE